MDNHDKNNVSFPRNGWTTSFYQKVGSDLNVYIKVPKLKTIKKRNDGKTVKDEPGDGNVNL